MYVFFSEYIWIFLSFFLSLFFIFIEKKVPREKALSNVLETRGEERDEEMKGGVIVVVEVVEEGGGGGAL